MVPPAERSCWASAIDAVNADIQSGVVAATLNTRKRYWAHWLSFLPAGVDPHLQNVDPPTGLLIVQIFAERVRQGVYGRGKQVKTGSVQAAIGAVAKTIELAGFDNPLHRPGTTNYYASLALQTESYRRADPTVVRQDAVPVDVPNRIFESSRHCYDRRTKAIGELALIAFYFLLRVGEYTSHTQQKRRTQQFRIQDIKFLAEGKEVPAEHLKYLIHKVDTVSLVIDNQKNGNRGDILSHHAIAQDNPCCPVRAVAARVLDLVNDGAEPDTLICSFREAPSLPWQHVRGKDMVKAVQQSVKALGLLGRGYNIKRIGSHSLRAGGATALFINKKDAMTIQRAGRWTSSTFMDYIHGQLDVTTRGLAQAMSTQTSYYNMAR